MRNFIIEKSSAGSHEVSVDAKNIENRILYLEGSVNEESTTNFIKTIIELNRIDSSKPIKVIITSPGGSIIHGLACYDAIQTSKAPVDTYCVGTAYSMGAVLFAAGRRRYILPHSQVMIHEPLIEINGFQKTSSIIEQAESMKKTRDQVNKILCKHTGKTKKEMDKATSTDRFFTAEEAISFGLADEICGLADLL